MWLNNTKAYTCSLGNTWRTFHQFVTTTASIIAGPSSYTLQSDYGFRTSLWHLLPILLGQKPLSLFSHWVVVKNKLIKSYKTLSGTEVEEIWVLTNTCFVFTCYVVWYNHLLKRPILYTNDDKHTKRFTEYQTIL